MKTWDDISGVDDLVSTKEAEIVADLLAEHAEGERPMCPYLKMKGVAFMFCGKGMNDPEFKPEPSNPVYCAKQELACLQLYCLGDYESCGFYKGTIKAPGE